MYSFPNLETVCCSRSHSNCCFSSWIQISQESGKVVQYSHLLMNFPQLLVIYIVKGFGLINEAEIDGFLELSCCFYDPTDVGNLISGSSAFLKSSLNTWKFMAHVLWSLAWRILSITLLVVWTFFVIALLWDWNENWPFPVLWPLLSFPNLWTYWVQHFNSIIFRIWNSSNCNPITVTSFFCSGTS